ncbi:MAG: TIGR03915 family putative DNA repair protein [Lachnospiraceae bacterium]|nr:TIGR03915 family putative DNA repair protein [Lachnospiraceae bacterium]
MLQVYQSEDTMEGIFTAIYKIYEDKNQHKECRVSIDGELFLMAEYQPVETDPERAMKVIRTIWRRFGAEDYETICYALSSRDPEKADAVYHAVSYGLDRNVSQGHLFDNLADAYLHKVFTLARGAGNESCHVRGFLRFEEVQQGFLYASIGPKNNILTFLMPHFADRFPMENFMIHDAVRGIFGVHPAGEQWYLVDGELLQQEDFIPSEAEEQYQRLFRHFCSTIAIKDRKNLKLQQNLLPLRFREYMVEFDSR